MYQRKGGGDIGSNSKNNRTRSAAKMSTSLIMEEDPTLGLSHTPTLTSQTISIEGNSNSSGGYNNGGNSRGNSSYYQYVKPNIELPVSEIKTSSVVSSDKHRHPVSKTKIILMLLIALLLPCLLYLVAGSKLGAALSYPFSLVIIPTFIILIPTMFVIYKQRGKQEFMRSRGVVTLMCASFGYYSILLPLYIACLLSAMFMRETDMITYIKKEYYSNSSWLLALPIVYLHGCVFIQMCLLSQCKLRTRFYVRFVSWPSSVFFTTVVLSLPLLIFLPFLPPLACSMLASVPFLLACGGLYQTVRTLPPNKWEVKDIMVRQSTEEGDTLISKRSVKRVSMEAPLEHEVVDFKQPLSIIQITDPHLGPIMSVERLEEICESTVKLNPDIVLLTGDFFTSECFNPVGSIDRALAPLKKLSGKTFACLGNHDYEEGCYEILTRALDSIGCCLLIDECVIAETRIGKVQVLGFDYKNKNRQEHIQKVCEAYPPIPHIPRIAMLHDPGAFKFIPVDYGVMTFSGHTHGGQIGLNCLGINLSLITIARIPDHSLWQNGNNYLYVHRGQGCRSLMGTMVLRVGVPTEDSLLQVYFENN